MSLRTSIEQIQLMITHLAPRSIRIKMSLTTLPATPSQSPFMRKKVGEKLSKNTHNLVRRLCLALVCGVNTMAQSSYWSFICARVLNKGSAGTDSSKCKSWRCCQFLTEDPALFRLEQVAQYFWSVCSSRMHKITPSLIHSVLGCLLLAQSAALN